MFLPVSLAFVEEMLARQRVESCDYILIINTGLAPNILLADIRGSSQINIAGPQASSRAAPAPPTPKNRNTEQRTA
jgi:hypothetical protein